MISTLTHISHSFQAILCKQCSWLSLIVIDFSWSCTRIHIWLFRIYYYYWQQSWVNKVITPAHGYSTQQVWFGPTTIQQHTGYTLTGSQLAIFNDNRTAPIYRQETFSVLSAHWHGHSLLLQKNPRRLAYEVSLLNLKANGGAALKEECSNS